MQATRAGAPWAKGIGVAFGLLHGFGIGNLLLGFLLAYVFVKSDVNSFGAGFITAGIVGFLFSSGFDSPSDLKRLPPGYTGGIWTNRIDQIAPMFSH